MDYEKAKQPLASLQKDKQEQLQRITKAAAAKQMLDAQRKSLTRAECERRSLSSKIKAYKYGYKIS